jgi:hypothetical protein
VFESPEELIDNYKAFLLTSTHNSKSQEGRIQKAMPTSGARCPLGKRCWGGSNQNSKVFPAGNGGRLKVKGKRQKAKV